MHLSRIKFARIGTGWLFCFYYFVFSEKQENHVPDIIRRLLFHFSSGSGLNVGMQLASACGHASCGHHQDIHTCILTTVAYKLQNNDKQMAFDV
jgi:hypothetical protein